MLGQQSSCLGQSKNIPNKVRASDPHSSPYRSKLRRLIKLEKDELLRLIPAGRVGRSVERDGGPVDWDGEVSAMLMVIKVRCAVLISWPVVLLEDVVLRW